MSETAEQLNQESAPTQEQAPNISVGAGSSMAGVDRWVYFTFIALGVVIAYVLENLGAYIIDFFREVPAWFGGASTVAGLIGAFLLYRHARMQSYVRGICEELTHVTWPSREETWNATIVVVVASVAAALYCGAFDALWSYLTDLIYNMNRSV